MRASLVVLVVFGLVGLGCEGSIAEEVDAGALVDAPGVDAPGSDAASAIDAFAPPETPRLLEGVTLDGIAVFQGTRIEIASAGAASPTRNAPIVALRESLVRAYVTVSAATLVTGELEVVEGSTVIAVHRDEQMITRSSREDDPSTVLDFRVPASEMTTTASLRVRLVDSAGTPATSAPHPARLPRDGSALAIGAADDGDGLHLVLVPLRWDGDGSGRLPDTSAAWLATVRALLLSLYPVVDLDITVRDAVPWSDSFTFTGNVDFGSINAMLQDLRVTDGAPNAAYYYAIVAPASSYSAYCGGSCVTGQSYVVDDPADGDFRVGSGVDFGSESSAWTLAHEVGHELGRYHAPCDTSGADVDYPYAGGEIGSWGWDARDGSFFDPSLTTDFMGYCDPTWTSDYTWSAIFERTTAVSALSSRIPARSLLVRLGTEDGAVVVGERTVTPPRTRTRTGWSWLQGGRVIGVGSAPTVELSHGDERLVVLPAPPAGADSVRIDGIVVELAP
jgi:hypothetical protein